MVIVYIAIAVAMLGFVIWRMKRKKGEKDVPQGLQVFDEQGRLILDVGSNTTRFLGSFVANSKTGSMSFQLGEGERLFAYFNGIDGKVNNFDFTISANTISWEYYTPPGTQVTAYKILSPGEVVVYYGVY